MKKIILLCLLFPAVALAGPLIDPTANPAGFVNQLLSFAHTAWPVFGALLLYGLLELAAFVGQDMPALAWLGKGRITLVIAGATGVLGAGLNAYLGGGNLQVAFVAAVVALAAYWHPQAPAVVAQKKTRAPEGGSICGGMMGAFAAVAIVAMFANASCSWWQGSTAKKDVDAGIACLKAEEALVTKGTSALMVGIQLAASFAAAVASSTVATWFAQQVAAYGEPVVACELKNIAAGGATPAGSASPSTGAQSAVALEAQKLLQEHSYKFSEGK